MVLKGFFANINMKPENKVTGSQGVVKLFMEYLSTVIHNFHIFFLFLMIFCTESANGCL